MGQPGAVLRPQHRLFDGGRAHRPPLRVVAVEQSRTRLTAEHRRQLPREVVDVLDAGVGPERPTGRHHMGGVPHQEHPARRERRRRTPRRLPRDAAEHLHVQVRNSGGGPHQLPASLLVVGRGVLGGRVERHVQQPAPGVVQRHQRTAHRVVERVAHDEPPLAQLLGEIGLEMDVEEVPRRAGPLDTDAERLPHGARRPVRRDEVVGGHRAHRAGLPVAQPCGDAVRGLLERLQFREVREPRAEFLRATPDHRFELVLVAQAPPGGRPRAQIGAHVHEVLLVQGTELSPCQRLGGQHPGVPGERPGGPGGADLLLQADRAHQLHGARIDAPCPRMRRHAAVPFHDQGGNPVPGQEQAAGQTGQPRPGHQHGNVLLLLGHVHPPPNGPSAQSAQRGSGPDGGSLDPDPPTLSTGSGPACTAPRRARRCSRPVRGGGRSASPRGRRDAAARPSRRGAWAARARPPDTLRAW